MNDIVGLVPMKGHSERVPSKNVKMFCGKPLFYWVIKALDNAKAISKICVNTDSDLLAEQVLKYFPEVIIINRPDEIKGDMVSMNKIIGYDLSQNKEQYFLQTHSTNPLLKPETIDRSCAFFLGNLEQYDSLFSVTKYQARLYDENIQPVNHNPKELIRTQDLPPLFEENSNFYVFSKESFEASEQKRIGLKPYMFEVPKLEALDIDIMDDFMIAEKVMEMRLNGTIK